MASEPDSAELERRADLKRLELSDAVERLRDNLRPDNLAQEALHHAYGNGSAAMNVIGGATRDNPIPVVLIGAGCAMLLGLGRRAFRPAPAATIMPAIVTDDRGLKGQVQTRPLLFGAIGVALGAALGSLVG